jgi:hypothetical protein
VLEKIYELDGAYSEIISNHPEEQWPKNANVVADTLRMLMPKICPEFIKDTTEMSIKLRTMMMELSSYKQSNDVIKSAKRKK